MPNTRRVFVGLPAYNEEIALPRLLDRIERLTASAALPITVVIYNDGSTDSTVPIARSRQQQMPLVILDCPINKGLGAGLRALVRGVPPLRGLTALGAAALFKLVHPVRGVWDYTCGYRAYRAGVLKKAASRYGDQLIAESGLACMVELLLKLNGLGARFAEIPLQLRYDQKPTETKMGVGRHTRRLLLLLVRWR